MTRDERQAICEQKFVDAKGIGTLECTPAFGKTRIATNILSRMKKKRPDLKTLVIVPREYLKRQWEEIIKDKGLEENTTVEIINSAVKAPHDVDFLMCDEIHRFAAPTFQQIFDRVKFKWILGLTGTMKRLDQKHGILTKHCPIIDQVSAAEAKKNGWVAEYMEFNLAIELPPVELIKYQKYEDDYDSYAKKFMYEFQLMQKCAMSYKPQLMHVPGVGMIYGDSSCANLAKTYGWTGNTPAEAQRRQIAKEADIWGGDPTHPYHPKKLYIWAINGLRAIRKIKAFVQNHTSKLVVAVELCQKIPVKTITFGESIKSADLLTSALLPDAISYHSGIKRLPGLTKKQTLEKITSEIKSGKYRIVNTARALDEGADFPEMQMGIRIAGSSSPTQHTQRRGRIVRKHGAKKAVMINLYLNGTKEVQWLTRSQGRGADVEWVESVDEIIEELTF